MNKNSEEERGKPTADSNKEWAEAEKREYALALEICKKRGSFENRGGVIHHAI